MDNGTKKIEDMEKQLDEWLEKKETIAAEVLKVLQKYDINTGEAAIILDNVSMALKTKADVKAVALHKEACPF